MKKSIKKTKYGNARQIKNGISGSYIISFENSGHSLFLEETHTYNEALIKFSGQ
jgi:pimeloyl-ACP methyl ester carboxylesterase